MKSSFHTIPADRRREVFLGDLARNLSGVCSIEQIAEVVSSACRTQWEHEGFIFSVRRSGRSRFRAIHTEVQTEEESVRVDSFEYDARLQLLEPLFEGKGTIISIRSEDEPSPLKGLPVPHFKCLLLAPVVHRQQLIGILSLLGQSPDMFEEKDLSALEELAGAVSDVLARCLVEQRASIYLKLGEKLNLASTPEDAARTIVETADELIGWDAACLALYSHRDDTIYALVLRDLIDGKRVSVPTKVNNGPPGPLMRKTLEEGPQLILREPEALFHTPTLRFGGEHQISASIIWVPIKLQDQAIGLLSIQSYMHYAYDEDDLQALQALADHCAGALERTRAFRVLSVREERYRSAITGAGAVPYQVDYATKDFVFVGDGIANITGYSQEEFTADLWRQIIVKVVMRGSAAGMPPAEAAQKVRDGLLNQWQADVCIRTRDGKLKWLSDTSVQLLGEMDKPAGSLGILHDISDRKLTEETLRESEAQLRLVIEQAGDAIYIHDENGYLFMVNEKGCRNLGYTREEMFKLHVSEMEVGLTRAEAEVINQRVHGGENLTIEGVHRRKDGTKFPVEIRIAEIEIHGRPHFLAIARDISDRRRRDSERMIFSVLTRELSGAEDLGAAARAVQKATEQLWSWDAFYISARRSGRRRYRILINADTIDGRRHFYSQREAESALQGELSGLYVGNPIFINRSPGSVENAFPRFGNENRLSASLIFVPMILAERVVGVMSVQSYTPGYFTENDVRMMQRLAEITAPAIERCRAEERTNIFASIGERLSSARSPLDVARISLSAADELIGWDAASFSMYNSAEDKQVTLLSFDLHGGERRETVEDGLPKTPVGGMRRCLTQGAHLLLRDEAAMSAPTDTTMFGDKTRKSASLMWVPVRLNSVVAGFASLQSYVSQAYDEHDLSILQALANHCSGALERTRAEEALRKSEEQYRRAITETGAVPYQRDYATERFVFIGEGIERLTGYSCTEMTAELWISLIEEIIVGGEGVGLDHKEAAERVRNRTIRDWIADIRIKARDGSIKWVQDTSIQLVNNQGTCIGSLGILQDITDRKNAEARLLHDAFHDKLTGLPNRALLLDRLEHSLNRSHRRTDTHYAVLFLDLDRFKNINDSLGHLVGDEVLKQVARRLELCLRPGDTVARFAGDEFTMLLDDVRHPEDVIHVAERVQKEISLPMQIEGHEVYTTASMGIALSTQGYEKGEEVLRDADNALYRAKASGKARYQVFDVSMHRHVVAMLEIENDLRRALDRNELMLVYQPIINIELGQLLGFEALLRWNHPTKGVVSPTTFIPVAEETGLIIPMGWWVIREACRQLREWQDNKRGPLDLYVTINLSAKQFAIGDLDFRVLEIVTEYGLKPTQFNFELTETILMEHPEAAASLIQKLKHAGFKLYLDDFGTGYSSLSYLQQFPFDVVKIDRSFVMRMEQSSREREIVRTIILLAETLNMGVTAEGVETREQLDLLLSMNCPFAQGFYFSPPIASDMAARLLDENPKW